MVKPFAKPIMFANRMDGYRFAPSILREQFYATPHLIDRGALSSAQSAAAITMFRPRNHESAMQSVIEKSGA